TIDQWNRHGIAPIGGVHRDEAFGREERLSVAGDERKVSGSVVNVAGEDGKVCRDQLLKKARGDGHGDRLAHVGFRQPAHINGTRKDTGGEQRKQAHRDDNLGQCKRSTSMSCGSKAIRGPMDTWHLNTLSIWTPLWQRHRYDPFRPAALGPSGTMWIETVVRRTVRPALIGFRSQDAVPARRSRRRGRGW